MRRVTVALLLAASACGGRPENAPAAAQVAARVGDEVITVDDVAAEVRRTGQPAAAALEDLIRLELVTHEARHGSKPGQDQALADLEKSVMVQRYLEREIEPRLTRDSIPDELTRTG